MIPSNLVKKFLEQPRDDHRWLKSLTHKDVDSVLASFRPVPKVNSKLRVHQKVCICLGIAYPQFGFWLDMGTGKTIIALELLRYWWECRRLNRAVVLVKNDKAFPTWKAQMKRWGIDLPYVMLGNSSSEEKWTQLEDFKAGIIFLAYPGATALCSSKVQNTKGENRMALDPKKVERLAGLDALVMDESTCAGHKDSLTSKLCTKLRQRAKFCYALAGRPFGRDPTLLWSQYYILDGGATFGETLGLFRAAFFNEEDNPYDPKGFSKNYTFKTKMKDKMMRIAQHRSIAYAEKECIEVPDWSPSIIEEVLLPEEAKAYYKHVVEEVIAARGNLREMDNAFLRMRQLSSGFLGFKNSETDQKVEIEFAENPKLELLLDLLDEVPLDRKAVIFYDYTHSGRKIYEALRAAKRKPIWLWSGTKDSAAEQKRFQEDPDCDVAIINNKVGAYSIDGLQVANYVFYFESPVGVLEREQSEKRVKRQGQLHKVFQYDLVTKGTLDKRILDFHKDGADLLKALRQNPADLLKNLD